MGYTQHKVQPGDDFLTIAVENNFADYRTIYRDPQNAALIRTRPANQLNPGDVVHIPDKKDKQVGRSSGNLHQFQIYRKKATIRISVAYFGGEPVAGQKYVLNVQSHSYPGTTSSLGLVQQDIDIPEVCRENAEIATLSFPDLNVEWTLQLGTLRPVKTPAGVQSRLNNLNFPCGEIDGKLGPRTQEAIKEFKAWKGADPHPDGSVSSTVESKLRKEHEAV